MGFPPDVTRDLFCVTKAKGTTDSQLLKTIPRRGGKGEGGKSTQTVSILLLPSGPWNAAVALEKWSICRTLGMLVPFLSFPFQWSICDTLGC